MIKLIFASGENGEFGTPTGMPWHRHKEDMQEFKRLTKDNLVVMGNETFKTLGSNPLPERENLILTNSVPYYGIDFSKDDAMFAKAHQDSFGAFLKYLDSNIEEDVFVIGGAGILVSALPYADVVFHTVFHKVTEEATVHLPFENFFEKLYDNRVFTKVQSKPSEDGKATFEIYVPQVKGHF
nr:MAG: dihydrofolate reductase [Bacteriophage sp.]